MKMKPAQRIENVLNKLAMTGYIIPEE